MDQLKRTVSATLAIVLQVTLVAFVAAAVIAAAGCAHGERPKRQIPAWAFQTDATTAAAEAHHARSHQPRWGLSGQNESADLVVAALQGAGLRFGTDGTMSSLWGYLSHTHQKIPPASARRGDIVFFATDGPGPAGCRRPDHAGIVVAAEPDGRITFVEARGGRRQRSFVDPAHPRLRRDAQGEVRNTFLRSARVDLPDDAPLLAGEMFCATVRPVGL